MLDGCLDSPECLTHRRMLERDAATLDKVGIGVIAGELLRGDAIERARALRLLAELAIVTEAEDPQRGAGAVLPLEPALPFGLTVVDTVAPPAGDTDACAQALGGADA